MIYKIYDECIKKTTEANRLRAIACILRVMYNIIYIIIILYCN